MGKSPKLDALNFRLPGLESHLSDAHALVVGLAAMPKPRDGRKWDHESYWRWREAFRLLASSAWRFHPTTDELTIRVLMKFVLGCRADGDNLMGGVLDALQGVIYVNDRQVRAGNYAIITDAHRDETSIRVMEFDGPAEIQRFSLPSLAIRPAPRQGQALGEPDDA